MKFTIQRFVSGAIEITCDQNGVDYQWIFSPELYISINQMWDCIKVFLKEKFENGAHNSGRAR